MLSAIGCMIVSFTYPSGFLLPVSLAIAQLFDIKSNVKTALLKSLLILTVGVGGTLFCFLLFQLEFNDWQAFIKVQAKYNHELQNPIGNMYNFLKGFDTTIITMKNVIITQSLFVIIGYIGLTVLFLSKNMYKNRMYLAVFICTTTFFIFPWLVGGELSTYRSEALLLPAIILIKDIKTDYITSVLSLLLFIGIPMSIFFFKNGLV